LGDNKPKDWSIADNNQPSQEKKTSLKTGGGLRGKGHVVMPKTRRMPSKDSTEGEERVENGGSRGHRKPSKKGKKI
jgi:hypothetical protein